MHADIPNFFLFYIQIVTYLFYTLSVSFLFYFIFVLGCSALWGSLLEVNLSALEPSVFFQSEGWEYLTYLWKLLLDLGWTARSVTQWSLCWFGESINIFMGRILVTSFLTVVSYVCFPRLWERKPLADSLSQHSPKFALSYQNPRLWFKKDKKIWIEVKSKEIAFKSLIF